MGDTETPINERCPAHSGMMSKAELTIWLIGILITINLVIGGYMFQSMLDIKTQLSSVSYRFAAGEQVDRSTDERLKAIESRLQAIERGK